MTSAPDRPARGPSGRGAQQGGALVTGAARGLGRDIARALAAAGYAVLLTDVDEAAAAETAQAIGGAAWASALDVRDAAACRRAATDTAERAGSLALWVNNAGILRTGRAWEHDAEERQLLFDVNTHGTINGTEAALELMRAAGRGHVINIVSLAGLVAPPGEAMYAATKHAVLAHGTGTLFDLRREGFRDVHVSALCPDGIWTPMLQERVEDPEAALSWSGTMLMPADVAAKVAELAARPRPVTSMPRWRGGFARLVAATPAASQLSLPLMMRAARRRQRKWGAGPPR